MNDQAVTTRGDATTVVSYDVVIEALAKLGVDVTRPDLIKIVTVDRRGVIVVRYQEDGDGNYIVTPGGQPITATSLITVKRGDDE